MVPPNNLKASVISVIVPVHNSEKFLYKCVESILTSTISDIEIILVVNNSQDSSHDICQTLASEDKRIVIIHTEQGGVSFARNLGLERATGDYLAFVDSDDYIDSDMYSILLSNMISSCADISICGHYKTEHPRRSNNQTVQLLTSNESITEFLNHSINGYVWDKLFKREIFGSIKFPENFAICEDEQYVLNTLINAKKVCISKSEAYHYVQHPESVCNSGFSMNRWDMVLSKIEIEKAVSTLSHSIRKSASTNTITEAIRLALYAIDSKADLNGLEKEITKVIRKRFRNIINLSYKSVWKVYGVLIAINFSLFKSIYKISSGIKDG